MWLSKTGRTPLLYGLQITAFREIFGRLHDHFFLTMKWVTFNMVNQFLELGGFLLPLSAWVAYRAFQGNKKLEAKNRLLVLSMGFGLLVGLGSIFRGNFFPFMPNILHKGGIGPLTLHDTYILGLSHYTEFPQWLWILLTLLSGIGAGLLLWVFIEIAKDLFFIFKNRSLQAVESISFFILLCFFIYMGPLILIPSMDRYLILPLAVLCILMAMYCRRYLQPNGGPPTKYMIVVTYSMVLLWGWYSIAGTHDYFSWNRVRWQNLHELINTGMPVTKIDGGFEFNGYIFHDNPHPQAYWHLTIQASKSNPPRSWWWVQDDEYLTTFGTIPNTQVEKMETFSRWFPFTDGRLYLLKRAGK
jgi:hypothetical protein